MLHLINYVKLIWLAVWSCDDVLEFTDRHRALWVVILQHEHFQQIRRRNSASCWLQVGVAGVAGWWWWCELILHSGQMDDVFSNILRLFKPFDENNTPLTQTDLCDI